MDLKSKVVFITGGAGIVATAFAKFFLSNGCKVAITDTNTIKGNEKLMCLHKEFCPDNVIFLKCDVTSDQSFEGAYDECERQFGTIDILINNAGVSSTDWKLTTEVNYGGVIRGTEIAMKKMSKKNGGKGGHVINIGSLLGIRDFPHTPFYSASKAGVVHYTRTVGHGFHSEYTNVIVQCLCPAGIESELLQRIEENCYCEESSKAIAEKFSNGNFLKPEAVAKALFKLLEEKKPGGILAIDLGENLFYVQPNLGVEVSKSVESN